ncbi:MAG: hypothetical protein BWY94_02126 [Actinobacteria bacterium ADurb.BinA094]|nr:MAG: hypothetical protein BWY94_02126 [Actinobacteria bacterium ADurb.BinA094]
MNTATSRATATSYRLMTIVPISATPTGNNTAATYARPPRGHDRQATKAVTAPVAAVIAAITTLNQMPYRRSLPVWPGRRKSATASGGYSTSNDGVYGASPAAMREA